MKKVLLHLFSFCMGIVAVFAVGSYTRHVPQSVHDLRFVLSDSVRFANGSFYTGGFDKQGQLDGFGKLTWSNGDQYEGQFVAGLFQGKGKFISVGVSLYEGEFSQGYMSGKGLLVYGNGVRYEGEFKKNNFEGNGKLTHGDGSVYEGTFHSSAMTGTGKWIYSDKSTYIGEVKNGVFHGKGEWNLSDGNKYTGDFVDGKMQGNGVYKTHKGSSYSGEFAKNEFVGKGVQITEDGDTLEGNFSHWALQGVGIKMDKDGNQWKGQFEFGQLNGVGNYIDKEGESYSGEFKYGSYSGKGKLQEKNGDIYDGEFKHGEKDGKGLLIYKEPLDGVTQLSGVWKNGRLIEGDSNLKIYSPVEVSDYAIAYQQIALNQALTAIQSSDPKKVELYSLVVAAYGTQEVFRRESKFIENLFNQRYGNAATAMYLTNSQRSLDEHPLATLAGIKQSIQKISEKMDKEKDIFFLYITSHGSKDKKISLTHNGLGLGNIDSKWLGDILKATGIKHKVIVLSACYSGGFIDDLKDSHSIIMTSASAERTSFGCGDDSPFTYFAKAYFKEALTSGGNFVDAFYKAKELVALWEKNEKQKESYPQIYTVIEVADYVKKWNTTQH